MLCEEESKGMLMMPTQSLTRDGLSFNEDKAVETKYSIASINVTHMHYVSARTMSGLYHSAFLKQCAPKISKLTKKRDKSVWKKEPIQPLL